MQSTATPNSAMQAYRLLLANEIAIAMMAGSSVVATGPDGGSQLLDLVAAELAEARMRMVLLRPPLDAASFAAQFADGLRASGASGHGAAPAMAMPAAGATDRFALLVYSAHDIPSGVFRLLDRLAEAWPGMQIAFAGLPAAAAAVRSPDYPALRKRTSVVIDIAAPTPHPAPQSMGNLPAPSLAASARPAAAVVPRPGDALTAGVRMRRKRAGRGSVGMVAALGAGCLAAGILFTPTHHGAADLDWWRTQVGSRSHAAEASAPEPADLTAQSAILQTPTRQTLILPTPAVPTPALPTPVLPAPVVQTASTHATAAPSTDPLAGPAAPGPALELAHEPVATAKASPALVAPVTSPPEAPPKPVSTDPADSSLHAQQASVAETASENIKPNAVVAPPPAPPLPAPAPVLDTAISSAETTPIPGPPAASLATAAEEEASTQPVTFAEMHPPAPVPPPPEPAAAPQPVLARPPAPPDAAAVAMAETMTRRGRAMLDIGDVSAARLLLERAADAGSGPAALAMGMTFDPATLDRLGTMGMQPDPAQAARWYRLALSRGEAQARAMLDALPTGIISEPATAKPRSTP